MDSLTTTERVPFRLMRMPCCGHQICWVNPRLPSYCPECGELAIGKLNACVLFSDLSAELRFARNPAA